MKYYQNSYTLITKAILIVVYGFFWTMSAQAGEIDIGSLQLSDREWSLNQTTGKISRLTNGSNGMVLVTSPLGYQGDKVAVLKNFLTTVDPQFQAKWKIKTGVTPHGYDVLYTSGFIKSRSVRIYIVTVALFSKNEVAIVALFDPGYKGKGDLQNSFGELLSSARFTNNMSPHNELNQGKRIDGFYVGIGAKTGVSVLAQTVVEVGAKGLWIKSDGRYALTEAGITGDFNTYCDQYPKNCGRYQIANGEYTTWRSGSTQSTRLQIYTAKKQPFSQQGKDLILGKTRYRHIPPLSDFRLNGDYRLLRADSATGVGDRVRSGYVETNYGFSQDGRFIKGGSVSMFSEFGNSSVLTSGNRNVRIGRYKINGYTLALSFDDGETQTKAFFMIDGVPVINGDLYEELN